MKLMLIIATLSLTSLAVLFSQVNGFGRILGLLGVVLLFRLIVVTYLEGAQNSLIYKNLLKLSGTVIFSVPMLLLVYEHTMKGGLDDGFLKITGIILIIFAMIMNSIVSTYSEALVSKPKKN